MVEAAAGGDERHQLVGAGAGQGEGPAVGSGDLGADGLVEAVEAAQFVDELGCLLVGADVATKGFGPDGGEEFLVAVGLEAAPYVGLGFSSSR